MLVPSACKMCEFIVLLHKSLVEIFAYSNTTDTVTILALSAVEFSFIWNFQLLCTNILRHVTLAMSTVRAGTLRPWIHFYDVVTFMKTVLNTKFTVKCVLRCLLVLATSQAHVVIITVRSCLQTSAKTCHRFHRARLNLAFSWTEIT